MIVLVVQLKGTGKMWRILRFKTAAERDAWIAQNADEYEYVEIRGTENGRLDKTAFE